MTKSDELKGLLEDLSPTEKLILMVVNHSGNLKSTRLQKLSLIIKAIFEGRTPVSHGAYYFGGFSDDVEEGSSSLRDEGIVALDPREGYTLSQDGRELVELVSGEDPKQDSLVQSIVQKFSRFSDRELTALTYVLFPELAEKSVIKKKMDELGNKIKISEFDLNDKDKIKRLIDDVEK